MGLFDLFKKGLARTREKLASGLRKVLALGRPIDEQLLRELQEAMFAGDVGPAATRSLMDAVRGAWKGGTLRQAEQILPFLQAKLAETWSGDDRGLRRAASGPTVILVVGINGSGKTTSVAKLCHYLKRQGSSVLVGACDTFRAAAIDQLTVWAERCHVPIVKQKPGADPAAVAFDACESGVARGVDFILLDTAGRLHTQDHLMRELDKIQRVIQRKIPDAPHEVLLVLDATIGQNALVQARLFSQVVQVSGLILAKLDGSAKGGVVAGIREQLGLPVKFVGLGETLEALEVFDPQAFAEAIFSEP